tara:strand:+ start:468 stop:740 length:273 start_codon:yes stop_codon:yes gene_type:complete
MTPNKTRDYNKDYYSRPDIKEAHTKYMKAYYLKNKERLLEKQQKYYVDNKDRIKTYMKTYMRSYKKKSLLGKDVVNPKSKIVDVVDKDKV